MIRYRVLFNDEYEDPIFDTEEEAKEYALYLVSCTIDGAETLHMSNPGDYDADDYEADYEIIEIEEE